MSKRAPDLLSRLAMPFFCGIPANMPVNPDGVSAPVVGSGPYFIKEWTKNRRIVLARNPHYRGPAPHNVNGFAIDIGLPLETIKLNIDRGATDTGDIPPAAHADLGRRYGVKKASPGRYFANPAPTILYLAMNHERRLFGAPSGGRHSTAGNVRLKKAVNFAIDRQAMLTQRGAYAGVTNDQYMPPSMRGFRNVAIYPRRPNLSQARNSRQWPAAGRGRHVLLLEPCSVSCDVSDRPGEPAEHRPEHGHQAVPAGYAVRAHGTAW